MGQSAPELGLDYGVEQCEALSALGHGQSAKFGRSMSLMTVDRAFATMAAAVILGAGCGEGASPAAPEDSQRAPAPKVKLGAFVLIAPGSFLMGRNSGFSEEGPVRTVTLTRAFELKVTEVTQEEWQSVMGSNPSKFANCGAACPVEQVSWTDVQEFLARLNEADPGRAYRLPTEAEWEYAAGAGATGDFGGTGVLNDMGWWQGNSEGRTHPVARKLPNAWGLYDMHGNVWEWVQDWFANGYYAQGPNVDPAGPEGGTFRGYRGGSWNFSASYARTASRFGGRPTNRYDFVGFRLARSK
jgi:formylglycine-generating enzyme required for sulfatase activity